MSLATLAFVLLVGLVGPILATPARLRIPVVVGEILLGVLVGRTGTGWVDAHNPILQFLATAGFALVMLVAGSNVPLRDQSLMVALRRGTLLAALVGVLAVPAGLGIGAIAGTGHGWMYAVLLASSSAALVMPVVDGARLAGPQVTAMVVQVAVADTVCIVALPLASEPSRALHRALGALVVIACGGLMLLFMVIGDRLGFVHQLQRLSKRRHFGLELRSNLIIVFGLAGLAQYFGVSVMLAGFVTGLVLAARGAPRRLAKQLFSVSDGFLAPVFFVWLGASLDLRSLGSHPVMFLVAGLLAAGAVLVHAAARLMGQPLPLALLAVAQLGVPVAAVTIGTDNGSLQPGEGGAILAAALVSIVVTSLCARQAELRWPAKKADKKKVKPSPGSVTRPTPAPAVTLDGEASSGAVTRPIPVPESLSGSRPADASATAAPIARTPIARTPEARPPDAPEPARQEPVSAPLRFVEYPREPLQDL